MARYNCETVKEYAEKCMKNHSRHSSVSITQVAISDRDSDVLAMDVADAFTTANPVSREYFLEQDFSRHHFKGSVKLSVSILMLSALVKNYSLQQIDVLVVDVKGYELSVLRGLSIANNKPSIVIIELQEIQHSKDNLFSSYAQARLMLHQNQYICVYADLINTIFVEQSLYEVRNKLEPNAN